MSADRHNDFTNECLACKTRREIEAINMSLKQQQKALETKPSPKDYHEDEDLFNHKDRPSPIPTVIAVVAGMLLFIAITASGLFK